MTPVSLRGASARNGLRHVQRFFDQSARLRVALDAQGVALALCDALGSFSGSAASLCAWRDTEAGAATIRKVWRGLDPSETSLAQVLVALPASMTEASEFATHDSVRLHAIEGDPGFDGSLALPMLSARGIRSSYRIAVYGPDGSPVLGALCLMREAVSALDVDQEVLLLLARQACCALGSIQSEQAIKVAKARFESISVSAVDTVLTIDASGVVTSVNEAAERMFGMSRAEILGRAFALLLSESEREGAQRLFSRRIEASGDQPSVLGRHLELQARRQDGSTFTVEVAISPIRAEGCSREFVGIVRDITERKALQQRIREADRLATIGTLAAGLGHDMNNMLFPIRAHLNSIVTKASETGADQVREHAEQVGRGVLYLQQLADALHFLALDPDGDGDGDGDGTTDLASWWQTCGPLLGRAVHRRATISHEIAEGLPPVEIPQHALTRAVLNLLTNAADAMAPGRPVRQNHVKVSARLASSTASVILEVADNGVGMTEAVRRRATDMFFTTRTRGLGTGLGLALVNRVVERAGGRLEIVSSPGRGTTVRLLLPCASASESVDGREVKVDLRDGRTKAVVAAILESAGATVLEPGLETPPIAWVVDGAALRVDMVDEWIARHSAETIVVVGTVGPRLAKQLEARRIRCVPDPRDYSAIEHALMMAVDASEKESNNG